ncbi:Sec-independent protein translocase TatB [Microbacterium sp. zg.B48]|uniref:Sec-independent protein translocase TatB n=1 Tax=unclassified Microbacterium TaxID=2609290 RepID=UPI00214C7FAC|nr:MULTISPECIES: Sec-independent protein translocase TatB [unclassified Microbacterium]MCR2762222.1 Sec-independent protein translocase TatB [Microbacterium sp. zg.B48]MCR2809771.1 Sec-independent protein translocase TatB [Microbacterium sp. zg.B185]WIM17918.1 Sec-independent protein translocase TatB [Microbacterium sp. zg-B185]
MFFGLTIEKLLLIGVVAGLLIGPERLPRYAENLTRFAKRAKEYVTTAKTRVKDEMGADFDDVDWRTLDPRQYDPRRIIREALLDDAPVPTVRAASAAAAVTSSNPFTKSGRATAPFSHDDPPPFDNEAT